MAVSQILIEEEFKRKLTVERDRLKMLGIAIDIADILAIARPFLRKQ
jgi:hypothetical protein